jgi:ABC-2 type transport system ATP-binding protein
VIDIRNLTKIYKKREKGLFTKKKKILALDHIDLHVNKNEVFGIIGPNGAGKTTLIKILSTLVIPDEGTAIINGYDLLTQESKIKELLGVVTGEYARSLYWRLTGKENLEFFSDLYDMERTAAKERIEELLEFFDLTEWANELVMKYSTGMKHKLALARALLNNPPVLLLDEPTTGIDPKSSHDIKQFVRTSLSEKTVLWTSHNLFEIEQVCDRVAMIHRGKIVMEGSPEELKTSYQTYIKLRVELIGPASELFKDLEGVLIENEYVFEVLCTDLTATLQEVDDIIRNNNVEVKAIQTLTPTLEDLFIKKVEADHEPS